MALRGREESGRRDVGVPGVRRATSSEAGAWGRISAFPRFLSSQPPPALTAAIDWSSLRLEPGSFLDSQFRQEGHLAGCQEAVLSNLQIRLSRYLWRTLSRAAFEGEMSKRPWALTVGVWSVRVLVWKEC